MDVERELKELADARYRTFHLSLIPGVEQERVLGVRVPDIRALARRMSEEDKAEFLRVLPHGYYDEDMLHAALISSVRDEEGAVQAVARFLPYVDNWAVCDAIVPKCFSRASLRVRDFAYECIASERLYTARWGINCLRAFFLDKNFDEDVLAKVAAVCGGYYLDMAAAWFFCDALIKRREDAVKFFEQGRLVRDVHVKAVRKACESFRLPPDFKAYLRSLPLPVQACEE